MGRSHEGGTALLRVLGPIDLTVDGQRVALSDLERALLASAALHGLTGGEELVDWLWGDRPPASARNRIQALVSGIRRKVAHQPVLLTEDCGYRLAPAVAVDAHEWRRCVDRARRQRTADAAQAVTSYDEALAHFTDQPLGGAPRTPRSDLERNRLDQERVQILEERLAAKLDGGLLDGVVSEAALLSGRHPYHEGFLALYVRTLGATGQQRRALEVYQDARQRLADELGIEPSAQLRAAHQRVLRGEWATQERPVAEAGLPVPQTLPRPPAGFIGRAAELDRLTAAAAQAASEPIVASVTGLIGIGKSALAARAGARLRASFPDGSLYADLSSTAADDGVHAELGNYLRLLGVVPESIPDDPHARRGLYRSLIDDRRVLVVIDNVDNRDGRVAANVADLLPTAAGSMAVITSRSPVEQLDPTLRITLRALSDDEAVALLEHGAGRERVAAEPDAVRELIQHTGALPLALRLVGGRLAQRPDLTVRSMALGLTDTARGLSALDECGGHECTLRASLTMVWHRFPEQIRLAAGLLAQLPLDAFGAWVPRALFGDAAGEAVLNTLVDACFVEPVILPGRRPQYRMHDIVVRFAREQQEPSPAEITAALTTVGTALLDRLARHHAGAPLQFLPLPESVPAGTPDALDASAAQELLLTELPTVRACARHLAPREPGLAWRLLAACENTRHMAHEPEAWSSVTDAVLAEVDPVCEDGRLGAAILALARAWWLQDHRGEYATALGLAVGARRELTLLGALPHAMAAGLVAANCAVALSDRRTADAELALVADAALRCENPVLTGWRHIVQGELHNDYDELPESEAELTRARDVLDGTGERIGYAYATAYLSRAYRRQGKLGPARILADEALEQFARFGAEHAYTVALDARAEVGVELERGAEALEQASTALGRARAARDAFMTARATRTRARALRVLGRLEEAADELRSSVEQFTAIDRTLSVAATLHDLAIVQDLRAEPAAASETLRQERTALHRAHLERGRVRREQIR